MLRRPRVVAATAAVLLTVGACARPHVADDPPGHPPGARFTVNPALRPVSGLADDPPWPDDQHRGTRSFVTGITQLDRDRGLVTWPRDVPAPASVPSYAFTDHLPDLAARADRLARALGLDPVGRTGQDGTLRYEGDGEAVLVVATDAGQQWAYARDGADCSDVDGTETASLLAGCARTRTDGQETQVPVSQQDARQRARPVLAAAGVDVEATLTTVTDGGRLLHADPTVAGRSTSGLTVGVLVDGEGVRAATGRLGEVTAVARYDVRPLADLVAPDGVAAGGLRCASPTVAPECAGPAEEARDVRLGYRPWWFGDSLRLVPVWLADDDQARLLAALPAVSLDLLPPLLRQYFGGAGVPAQ